MKKTRRIPVILIALSILLAAFAPSASASTYYGSTMYGDFEVLDGVLAAYWGSGGNVVIPGDAGITSIGYSAFSYNLNMLSVFIPEGVTTIEDGAFQNCEYLTAVTFPQTLTTIGEGAFGYNHSLTSVEFPDSLTTIGRNAFANCDNLTAVTLPAALTSIGNNTFVGCDKLTAINVDANNAYYASKNGVLFDINGTLMTFPCGKKGGYAIPGGTTAIGDGAFSLCNLSSVTIPEGVTSIGAGSFAGCLLLNSDIVLPNSLGSCGAGTFSGSNITGISIGSGLGTIAISMFSDCWCLVSVIVPENVTRIDDAAFCRCGSLKYLALPAGLDYFGTDAISYCDKVTIYGQAGTIAEQAAAAYKRPFSTGTAPYEPGIAKTAEELNPQPESADVSAVPTGAKVTVNGKTVAFEAYNIGGNNYFKLRDLAMALSGSSKQFEVTWDKEYLAIVLTSGKPYTPVGGELAVSGDSAAKDATYSYSPICLNGEWIDMYYYNIDGYNYFKLRDIGKLFDIGVTYLSSTKTIVIDTTQSYSD
jgi:hypothetical protein